jgi:hypothetical protein
MIWAVVCALIASISLNALLSVLIVRIAKQGSASLERAHARTTEYTEGLVDRIISGDYQTYKAYEMVTQTGTVGHDEVEPEPEVVRGPDKGGFGSRLGLAAYVPPEIDEIDIHAEIP